MPESFPMYRRALASQQPARLLGLRPPSLEEGQPADLIQFTVHPATASSLADIEIHVTLADGEIRHG